MAAATRFLDLLTALTGHEVEFVVVGGVAAVLEGAPLSTFDLDVVPLLETENLERLASALREVHAVYRDPAGRRLEPKANGFQTGGQHQLSTDLGPVDVLGRIGAGWTYQDLRERSRTYTIGNLSVRVLTLEAVIRSKEETGREKDLAALPLLRRALKARGGPASDREG